MPSNPNWFFVTKDLDRTDFRRDIRFRRDHVLPESGISNTADSTTEPSSEVACREFLDDNATLLERYRRADGRTKQELRRTVLHELANAGIVEERDAARLGSTEPRRWPRLRAAA